MQRDLFTVRASFYFNPYRGPRQVSFVQNLAGVDFKPTVKDGAVEMELSNIPAFDREEYSPPEAEIKPQIRFHYGGAEVSSPQKFWANAGKLWYEAIEKFIGNDKEIREAAHRLVSAENDPEKKLRILYERVQQVRNLSYERRRTQQEEKKEKLKDSDNAADVFKRGYGHRWDINRLFVALARGAGFEARVVRVAERDDHFFDMNMLSYSQFDGELAVVNLNAKDIYLDPGTRFCPFGAVRWTRTSVTGRSLDKNGGSFFTTPLPGSDAALTRRDAEFTLDEQGRLAGRITVQLSGQEAMNRRIAALYMDESGRKQDFENDLKRWLPVGAEVKLEKSTGWESSEEPLVAEFSVDIPGYASVAGKRLLLPTGIFQAQQKNPFPHPIRKHPVYFAYPYRELDNIGIKLPESVALERLPRGQSQTFPHGRIRVARKANGNELLMTREFQVDGVLFPTEDYFGLRDLFSKLQSVDEEQAVLRRTESTTAGASN